MSGRDRIGPPQHGGLAEELLEFPGEIAEVGEYQDIMTTAAAEQIRLLQEISGIESDLELVGGSDGDEDIPTTPTYFSSGPEPITVNNQTMSKESWGFSARTVNMRFNGAIEVSFVNPENNDDSVIGLTSDDSPFTTAGVVGLFANKMWYRKPEDESSNPELRIIAIE